MRTSYDTNADVLLDILLLDNLSLRRNKLKIGLVFLKFLFIHRVYSQLIVQNTISGILK